MQPFYGSRCAVSDSMTFWVSSTVHSRSTVFHSMIPRSTGQTTHLTACKGWQYRKPVQDGRSNGTRKHTTESQAWTPVLIPRICLAICDCQYVRNRQPIVLGEHICPSLSHGTSTGSGIPPDSQRGYAAWVTIPIAAVIKPWEFR